MHSSLDLGCSVSGRHPADLGVSISRTGSRSGRCFQPCRASQAALTLRPLRRLFGNTERYEESLNSERYPRYGCELTADQWSPVSFAALDLLVQKLKAEIDTQQDGLAGGEPAIPGTFSRRTEGRRSRKPQKQSPKKNGNDLLGGDLPKKLGILAALVAFSRLGVYIRLPGVDVDSFADSLRSGGLLSYIDALSGGSISRVGLFSLGIVPAINASIVLQLLSTTFPSLKKLQREEGPQGRARFQIYQKLLALLFATAQGWGALLYVRPYVPEWSGEWLLTSLTSLVAGSVILGYIADQLTDLKLGNGTSILITANIASALPASVGAAVQQSASKDSSNLAIYAFAFFLTTLGVVYVQEAERQLPMNYASRYRNSELSGQAYLPFKVNATGVMPVIFATTLLSLPQAVARYQPALLPVAGALGPTGPLYLPVNVALIVMFNYFYTFQQLDPKDLADQLKRQGASLQGIRPGRNTAEFITRTLNRMSLLGSGFLGLLAAAPAVVEAITKLQAFRGFAGTSVLIMVGVATDTARRFRAEQAMSQYGDVDRFYDDNSS